MADVQAAAEGGLLRNRAFLAIWSAQILSLVGANAITSALIILVAEITKSNTSSSVLILLAIAPAVLFGILAGMVADRSDRRRVLIVTNALRALAVIPLLTYGESVATAYVVNFLVASITIFFVPAEGAMLPALVRRSDLLVANSLFTFTFNGAFVVGFVILAPVMIAFAGFQALFVVIALMFVGAALLCLTLPASPAVAGPLRVAVAGEAVAQTRRGMSEAWSYLRSTPVVTWSLIYIALTYTLIAMAGALSPGFVREVLGARERDTVILIAPAGLGVVAGLGLLNLAGQRVHRPQAIGAGLVVIFGALLSLAGARPVAGVFRRVAERAELGEAFPFFVAVVAVTAFAFGVAYAFIAVPAMTLLQEELADEIRGRVFGVLNVLVSVFSFLPLLIVGPVADVWGVAPVFLGAAVAVSLVWLLSASVRRGVPAQPAART